MLSVSFATGSPGTRGWALLLCLAAAIPAQAQSDSLRTLTQRFTTYQQQALQEKVYLHLDRPLYLSGEVLWFKAYVTDGTSGKPLAMSKIVYVEVLDRNRQPVLQAKVPLRNATGQGSFQLPAALSSGSYTVRAYTNWMKNFSPEFYFHAPVTFVNTLQASGVVSTLDTTAYDVQFFPEGGNLVRGVPSKVAFKVSSRTGQSVAVEGTVLDGQGQTQASFRTLKFGMGSFNLTPATTAPYTAVLKLPNGRLLTRQLPAAFADGYVLRLTEADAQHLRLTVQAPGHNAETVYLLGHARQRLALATTAPLRNGQAEFVVDKQALAEGISHFTLFNGRRQPVCERLYFRRPTTQLALQARPDKRQYAARSKVSLQLTTATATGQALPANLSVAVYRTDSLVAETGADIRSYLWLTSDLVGAIEDPAYYFDSAGPEAAAATDNLMLTHGWSRFRWEDVLRTSLPSFRYLPELNGHLIRGHLTQRQNNQPAPDITAYLTSPGRPARLSNATSTADGTVLFETADFYGPRDLVVQTNTQRDSTYRIELDSPYSQTFASSVFTRPFTPYPRFRDEFTLRHLQNQVQTTYSRKYNSIFAQPSTDTLAFFGKPDEKYWLDDYTRFKTLEEVLREYVPGVKVRLRKDGYHFNVLDNPNRTMFTDEPLVLLDGMPVFNTNKLMAFDPAKIRKLEVLDSRYFQGRALYNGIISFSTYKGNLEGFPLDARALVQEYDGLQRQREFYAPRYDTPEQQQSPLPDLRNLVYWNPQVNTVSGRATSLEFFTPDQPGQYRVVVQGLATTGAAGSTSIRFDITPAQ
ncbi:MG2 domain-containing protein [Hymenobacter metallilatus]|uniref:Macroglobulin domain-containing protein n=1 Tax=Hymenobacter metallilatus TaxID=2493666 RepID=A0A3R9NEB6_9BACT|nr:MG2 domain-containing protein [Hymenobacter metallilatus]RSK30257.1 hypothetical protein EI290_15530 [Hymenobacter metallilatus]